MTLASLLVALAGLSHREASDYLNVRLDTINSWSRANNPKNAGPGIIAELKALIAMQELVADRSLSIIAEQMAQCPELTEIDIAYPADDHEAQSLGFPCVGAWKAMAGRVVARCPVPVRLVPVRLVPCGSTPETAAAMQMRGH